MYIVIHTCEGDTTVTHHSKEELEKLLNERHWGNVTAYMNPPGNGDTNYWTDNSMLIIKGNVVTPEETKTVLEYKLP